MKLYVFCLVSFLSFSINAQVVINEYSASNLRMFKDNYGKHEDWIELYNNDDSPADISGWYLSDKNTKPKKWQFPVGTVIAPGGFLLVWVSGRNVVSDTALHTNFKFTQSNKDEFVVLSNSSGVILESYTLMITQLHHSMAKSKDGNKSWKICTNATPGASNETVQYFNEYASTPVIKGVSGFYKDSVIVSVSNNGFETIRYTLDGSVPDETSEVYTNSLIITESAVLSVRSFSEDTLVSPGFTDFKSFFINEPVSTLPIISIGGGDELIRLAEGERELQPIGSCEVFTKEGTFVSKSFGELDSHGQDSWVNDQRSLDWISRDEMGHDSGIPQKLFKYSERDEYQRIILRASGDDNYPAVNDGDHEGSTHVRDEFVHTLVQKGGMNMDVRSLERYLVYLNGKYWGVYTIREKPDDHDYTEFTYKQDKFDLQFLKTWGSTWIEYGEEKALKDWIEFKDFVLESDVSDQKVYDKINKEMDVISLMDYMIANLTCVSSDWLNYNTGWWRGLNESGGHKKWGYVMWDNDATFDYYINYSGVPDTSPNAKACDIESISTFMDEFFPMDTTLVELAPDSFYFDNMWNYFPGDTFYVYPDPGKHEKIFLKLLEENRTFRDLYFARYADLLNGVFSCSSMIKTLDSLVAIIRPEMPRHIKRWGGNILEWERNIKRLRDFVSKRCARVNTGLINCYDLTGPYNVTVTTFPPGKGNIIFNTQTHQLLPWSGKYFGKMNNKIEVVPKDGDKFLYWKSSSNKSLFSTSNLAFSSVELTANDTLIAVFEGAVNATDIFNVKTNIYPNPADNIVKIAFEDYMEGDVEYELISSEGKLMLQGNQIIKDQSILLNISEVPVGAYIIKVHALQNSAISKLIIMR